MPRPLGGGQPWNRGPPPQPPVPTAMGIPGGMIGQPGFMGQPPGMIGQVGQPAGLMGQPAGFMGQPGNIMGQTGGMAGQHGLFSAAGQSTPGLAGVPSWAVPAPPVQHPPPPSSLAGPIQTTSSAGMTSTMQRLPLDTRFMQNSGNPANTSTANTLTNIQGPMYPAATLGGGAGAPFQGFPFGPPPPHQFGAAPNFSMPQAWTQPWTQQQ